MAPLVAIFDIQNTLQNFVSPSINSVEETGYVGNPLLNSANESTPYTLVFGSETSGVVSTAGSTTIPQIAFGGTKEYFEVPYNPSPFIPVINQTGVGCTYITQQNTSQTIISRLSFLTLFDLYGKRV